MSETDDHVRGLRDLMDERDKRYEQRFQAQENALRLALEELKQWKAGANEWRDAMDDREADFARKSEMHAELGSLRAIAQSIKERLDKIEGRGQGIAAMVAWVTAGVMALFAALSYFWKGIK